MGRRLRALGWIESSNVIAKFCAGSTLPGFGGSLRTWP